MPPMSRKFDVKRDLYARGMYPELYDLEWSSEKKHDGIS